MLIRNYGKLLNNFRVKAYKTYDFHTSSSLYGKKTIAIRREDHGIWERRAPLAPNQVRKLVAKDGYRVLVQPSNRRAFPIQVYSFKI